jgi:hypothetical protein
MSFSGLKCLINENKAIKLGLVALFLALFLPLPVLGATAFTTSTEIYLEVSTAGIVTIPQSYCDDDPLLQNTNFYWGEWPEDNSSSSNWGCNSVDICGSETCRNLNFSSTTDYNYWYAIHRIGTPDGSFHSLFQKIGGLWYSNSEGYVIPELGIPELPALEECSELGITERLLCELKNFFYRLFVPSPDKVTELRSTINSIQEKFPYNYILAIKNFFDYLRENINDSQEISFNILGQAGVVSFAGLNSTTTLAGTPQTIISIFKKVMSFGFILLFAFWCFSFIKRIFR